MFAMEENLLDELYASYNGHPFAIQLKKLVARYGDLKTAEMLVDNYEDSQHQSQRIDVLEFKIDIHLFWPRVKREFDKLVCGHSQYAKESADYYVFGKFFSLATASSIASTISPLVSIPTYILTPTIVLLLHSMIKIGRNAYCSIVEI